MNKDNKIFTLIFLPLILLQSWAQKDSYIVIKLEFDEEESDNSGLENSYNNSLSVNGFGPFLGEFVVYYERLISKKIGLEIGFGATFGFVKASNPLLMMESDKFDYNYDESIFDTKLKTNIKPSFSLAGKYFINKAFGHGFYVGSIIGMRKNEIVKHEKNRSLAERIESNSLIFARIDFGYSVNFGNKLALSLGDSKFDFYIGMGAANVKLNRSIESYDPISQNYNYTIENTIVNRIAPFFGAKYVFYF